MANRNFVGPMVRAIRNRLKEAGVSETVIAQAVHFGPKRAKSLRFSKTVKRRIQALLLKPQDKCILTLGGSGKIRVLSIGGHDALVATAANARSHKHLSLTKRSRSESAAIGAKARWAKYYAEKAQEKEGMGITA